MSYRPPEAWERCNILPRRHKNQNTVIFLKFFSHNHVMLASKYYLLHRAIQKSNPTVHPNDTHRRQLLQWGRAPEGAERVNPKAPPQIKLASMGPRPGGRGESDLPGELIAQVSASMGPRPGGRGECSYGTDWR